MRKILSSKTPGVLNNVHYNTSVTEFCRRLIKPTVLFLCTENMFYLVGFVDSSLLIVMESVTLCNSMPLVRLGLTICVVKCSYFLVRHRVYKITLLLCVGGSRQSLKVHEVKCVPGDPATTCPVLFKGSCSLLLLA